MRRSLTTLLIGLLLCTGLGQAANAQHAGSTLDFPTGETVHIGIDSGQITSSKVANGNVFDELIVIDGAASVRLFFGRTRLSNESVIRMTSLLDGEVQVLDGAALHMWNNTSAYFNGNTVRVELLASPGTTNAISIASAVFEPIIESVGDGCGICNADDRAPSDDNRFARLLPAGCSTTIYNADSCFVTAGHCLSTGMVVEFNVPSSSSNCSINHPPVADQFPITNYDGVDGGVGNDYGALKAGTNGEGQTPYDRYGMYIELAGSTPSTGDLTVNGYGVDSECVRSQTQQLSEGPNLGTDSDTIYYNLDVTYGNSGSSIVYNNQVVGVVTHCSYDCENYGTRIDVSAFQNTTANVCAGGGGGGDCPSGEIEDCNGNCCPANWVGDGLCDDGAYTWNGIPIYLNCAEFNCDGGDCTCDDDPVGACCVGDSCSTGTAADCNAAGGDYQGDGSTCDGDPCGGGGGGDGDTCSDAVMAYEGANAFSTLDSSDSGFGDPDESQCSGTYLDWDGSPDTWLKWTASGSGTASFTTCDASSYDTSMVIYEGGSCSSLVQVACNGDSSVGGDCQAYHSQIDNLPVSGGQTYWVRLGGWLGDTGNGTLTIDADITGDPTGACCVGESCSTGTSADCNAAGGKYLGDGSSCSGDPCVGDPTGACCVGDNCSIGTAADCNAAGGDYHGDGSNCNGNPCGGGGDPTGACCVGDNCSIGTAADCNAAGGDYHGDDSNCNGDPCGGGGGDYELAWSVAGVDRLSLDQPNWTVDLYIEVPQGATLEAVAGTPSQQKTLISTTSFYQDGYGGPTSRDVNPKFYPIAPDLEWDSRVTIGCLDTTGAPFDDNVLQNIGIDWGPFEAGGDLSAGNGLWFVLPTDAQGESRMFTSQDCSERSGVLIGRLTTMELSSEIMFEALIQGHLPDGNTWQSSVAGTVSYNGEQDCNMNQIPDACDIANGTSQDTNGNGIPDECDSACPGDFNNDGVTDVDDILEVINGFGVDYDVDDLLLAISDFGCTG